MIGWEHRDDGIVVLTLDDPARWANAMNQGYVRAMASTVDRLETERATITGVVITSAKDTFLVGMDLTELNRPPADVAATGLGRLAKPAGQTGRRSPRSSGRDQEAQAAPDRDAVVALANEVRGQLRRLETFGRPVVAAMAGSALGGGLELALACHHRIALDEPGARFGLPEVTLGLLPGGGGVTRVVRLLGVQDALTDVLLKGQRMRPEKAVAAGIVDELAPDRDALMAAAQAWIRANPNAKQPWDRPGYRIPGGRPSELAMLLPALPANLRKQLKGAHYPAAHHIMCAAVEGAAVDIDTALRIEGRWFADLLGTPIQRNMTQAFFFDLQHLNRGGSRPAVKETRTVSRVGVIGAGMMGAGIAQACARAGLDVTIVDVTRELAERAATAERITPSASLDDLAGCDAVIEAVFEDLALKHETFRKLCAVVGPETLVASNTSSLPITSLAEAVERPGRFLGLHFFSPVHRMPLVEIIRGRSTSDGTLARGYDLVRRLDKTPIVVNDSRGFFTSRVFGTRVLEGVAMLGEGVPASSIEQAALQAGYPVGPLAVLDEVSLSLGHRLRAEARRAGLDVPVHPGEAVIDRMVELGRAGRAAGGGFYEYGTEQKRLWPGLATLFRTAPEHAPSFMDIQERMLFIEALEAVKCLDEGVLTGIPDGNIGSIFGTGFPAWTGGVLRYVDQYPIGAFVARANELASRYGARFTPPESLSARE